MAIQDGQEVVVFQCKNIELPIHGNPIVAKRLPRIFLKTSWFRTYLKRFVEVVRSTMEPLLILSPWVHPGGMPVLHHVRSNFCGLGGVFLP
jgi:hypothetical protein